MFANIWRLFSIVHGGSLKRRRSGHAFKALNDFEVSILQRWRHYDTLVSLGRPIQNMWQWMRSYIKSFLGPNSALPPIFLNSDWPLWIFSVRTTTVCWIDLYLLISNGLCSCVWPGSVGGLLECYNSWRLFWWLNFGWISMDFSLVYRSDNILHYHINWSCSLLPACSRWWLLSHHESTDRQSISASSLWFWQAWSPVGCLTTCHISSTSWKEWYEYGIAMLKNAWLFLTHLKPKTKLNNRTALHFWRHWSWTL